MTRFVLVQVHKKLKQAITVFFAIPTLFFGEFYKEPKEMEILTWWAKRIQWRVCKVAIQSQWIVKMWIMQMKMVTMSLPRPKLFGFEGYRPLQQKSFTKPTFIGTLFEIFIFCPKNQLWFPGKIVDFFGWKTRENVGV